MKREKFSIKETFKLAGKPGFLLIGYYIIQVAFARQRSDMGAVDASAAFLADLFVTWHCNVQDDRMGKITLGNISFSDIRSNDHICCDSEWPNKYY